jgi:hypothetical protein
MKTDKFTKSLLAAIAIALWMIAMNPWLRPTPVAAQESTDLSKVESSLSSIQSDVSSMETDLKRIARGVCTNSKIC